jgi:hypothetical protein
LTDNIYIYYHPLPDNINEAVLTCFGGYTVYIDPRQSKDGIQRSYEHAMQHIKNGDFFRSNVQDIENQAHKKGD